MTTWSDEARSVWGKTDREAGRSLPLVQHLEDAAAVAGHLWDTWVPGIVRGRLADAAGSDVAARTLVRWLAGVHDVGKATPAFAQQARDVGLGVLVDAMARAGLDSMTLARNERVHHTVTGHVAVQDWLAERGYSPARARALASVVGAHHGVAPQGSEPSAARQSRAMGGAPWQAVRTEILDRMVEVTDAEKVLTALTDRPLSLPALIDLSALVIIADWIASDEANFPYDLLHSADRLTDAIPELDLRGPWRPGPFRGGEGLFRDRFPHLAGSEPSALQLAVVEAATVQTEAPLMVIEAPTGSGKSEAALLAAEALAARHGAGGVFVGLPTMATSNAMFARVLRWVETWAGKADPTLWLAHGKAQLNQDFSGLVHERHIRGVHDGVHGSSDDVDGADGAPRVSSWLSGRKRGLLANVVVGTIDQVLMGALQARHLALRHLALSSKVVVVDEVHSADTHMRSFLLRMLDYLGAYGTPVLLLSATLPPAQRAELVAAYQAGRARARAPKVGGLRRRGGGPGQASPAPIRDLGPGPEAYPLVTVAAREVHHRVVPHDGPRREVRLEPVEDDLEVLRRRLGEELRDGGCVAVVRNTVRRAQEAYDALWTGLDDVEVRLFHSRFLACERAQRERDLAEVLGPDGQRPERLVVVGTQVLEQSLDIDVDLMVSDLAPVDLVIQRLGRLHRHPRTDRPHPLSTPRCLVTGVDWSAVPPDPVAGSRAVYEAAHLLRSLAVLQPHLGGEPVVLPADGPRLVHAAYAPDLATPAGWEETWAAAEKHLAKDEAASLARAQTFQTQDPGQLSSLVGWSRAPADDRHEEVGRAQVRDSEDGIEVIVVQRDAAGHLRTLPGQFRHSGRDIPYELDDSDGLTRHLATCTVGLPRALTEPWTWERTVRELEQFPEGDRWQGSRWVKGQLPLVLDDDLETHLNGHLVRYSPDRGLDVTRLDSEGTA